MNIFCNDCKNENCIIKNCLPESKEILNEHKGMLNFSNKTKVISQGGPVAGIYFIYSGKVKVFIEGRSGREQILRCAKDGEVLGHRGYPARKHYSISAIALEDSVICFFEREVFLNLLETNSHLTYELMFFYASELQRMDNLLMSSVELNTGERIANTLLKFREFFGVEVDGITIANPVSRQDVAKFAGTVPEVATRTLKDLASKGIIKLIKRRVQILDEAKLIQEAGQVLRPLKP